MNAKHTPGPWAVTDCKSIKRDYKCIGLSAEAGETIAAAMGGSTSGPHFVRNDDEVEANARLIAAAPELLDAIIELRDAYQEFMRPPAFKANAAIAKATGEQ